MQHKGLPLLSFGTSIAQHKIEHPWSAKKQNDQSGGRTQDLSLASRVCTGGECSKPLSQLAITWEIYKNRLSLIK